MEQHQVYRKPQVSFNPLTLNQGRTMRDEAIDIVASNHGSCMLF